MEKTTALGSDSSWDRAEAGYSLSPALLEKLGKRVAAKQTRLTRNRRKRSKYHTRPLEVRGTNKPYRCNSKSPLVRQFHKILTDSGLSYAGLEKGSGVPMQTTANWFRRRDHSPTLSLFCWALDFLGYELVIRRKGR